MHFVSGQWKFTGMSKKIQIEVAYARPDRQKIISLEVDEECTVELAIKSSGILNVFPEIDLSQQAVGIFGERKKLSDRVSEGDRIEIYRALLIDPKEARRKRAQK